ncbi:uncharacterized protein TNCV_2427211 [Trichonephila clavipes]|nr:uncharacterized protein TNCV_2427211 [Trichonephila clavipes]
MDDNATCHRTLAVQDCLDSEGIQRLVWPVRSPDLNPIENVWDALGRQVAGRNYPPTNKNTLIRALTEEWDKLPQQLLDNVVQRVGWWLESFVTPLRERRLLSGIDISEKAGKGLKTANALDIRRLPVTLKTSKKFLLRSGSSGLTISHPASEWYRYRIVACLVTCSSPVPLKTRRVGQRCTLNLSRAETSSRWCGEVVRRGVPAQVSSTSLDHGSKLRGPSPKALV